MSQDGASPPSAGELVVEVLGVAVGIPVTDAVAVRLRRQWSRALTDRASATVVDLAHLDGSDEVAHDYAVTTRVTLAALDATAGQRLNLHAGVVADGQGRALAVVGASGAGKTTAVHRLAHRLGYLSDETTSLDDRLLVHPHPKPLSVIADPHVPLVKQSLSPDDLGLARPTAPAYLHRIVLLARGDDDAGLVPLAPAHAIARIVAQSSSLTRLDHPIRRLADTIEACGGAWELRYREIEAWLDALVTLLDGDAQPPSARRHHPGADGVDPVPGSWSRVSWRDAVEYDDELVVMVESRVHVLAGLGVVLWLALESPRTREDLVAEIVDLWGARPDAPALVADALELLADEGMLRRPT